jgi:hypothetical protein
VIRIRSLKPGRRNLRRHKRKASPKIAAISPIIPPTFIKRMPIHLMLIRRMILISGRSVVAWTIAVLPRLRGNSSRDQRRKAGDDNRQQYRATKRKAVHRYVSTNFGLICL